MKVLGIIVLILAALIAGLYFYVKYKTSNVPDRKDLEGSIDKQIEKELSEQNSYGIVVGIVKNGRTMIKGYGTTVKGKHILPDSNSVFELASTSKLFTTSVLQLLADDGQLKIDDRLQSLLGDKVLLPAAAQNTTLQHLATHLSGFPSLPGSFLAKMKDTTNPYKDLVTTDIYDYLKNCEGKQADGTFEYSNFGVGLLGHLLSLKTGMGYEQLIKQRLLSPLGMQNTFVTIDSTNKHWIVQGYDEQGNEAPVWTDNVLTGAGSFLSNGRDMIQFIKANLNAKASPVSNSLLKTHDRQLDGETGLGWILASSVDKFMGNKDLVWHNGMAGGYASFLAIDKTNNYGVIVLSNKAIDMTKLGMILTMKIRTQSWKD